MSRRMKNSGIEWIGEIPEDWEVRKLGNLANLYTGNSIKDNEKDDYADPIEAIPYLGTKDVNMNNTINYNNGMYIKEKDVTFKRAYPNSTLVCIEGGSAGRKIANLEKEVAFGNKLCCIDSNAVSNRYIYYYILSPSFSDGFQSRITGLIPGVSISELGQIEIPIPSNKEQERIANFLDKKVSEIDNILEKTKESIEEYKKYKQSIITEAVTKGLNPDVEMKDSGIEWIGEIPKHWEITKVKYISSKIGSGKTPLGGANVYSNDGVMFLRSQNVYNEGLYIDDVVYISKEIDEDMKNTRVFKGDILLNITGGSIGRATIYPFDEYANVNQHVCIIRVGNDLIFSKLLHYILISSIGFNAINIYQSGANREGLNFEQIGNFEIPLMNIEEQTEIIRYLDIRCSNIDSLITTKEQLLSDLESYKKSLIYECVTGKREV